MKILLDLPPEFIELCKRDNVTPETVLRSFIADMCGLERPPFHTHGPVARNIIRSYYEHAGFTIAPGGSKSTWGDGDEAERPRARRMKTLENEKPRLGKPHV